MKLFLYCFRAFDEKEYYDRLAAEYGFTYDYTDAYPGEDNAALAAGCDGISFTPCDMNASLLEKFAGLGVRYLLTRSIGYDHIDLKAARSLGMRASCVAYEPDTVADYAIMMILMSCRKICHIIQRSGVQDYSLKGKIGKDITDCTVGIIGTGKIGKTVIRHLSGFGCRVLACSKHPDTTPLSDFQNKNCELAPLETLYRESDIISLHIPGSAENYHLLDRRAFAQMRDGVMIVNTARGNLIDADALIEALENGRVSHAALDVLEKEDGLYYANRMGDCIANRQMAILRSFPNVLLTPHTAFYTAKVVQSMAQCTVQCMYDMRDGRENPLIIL